MDTFPPPSVTETPQISVQSQFSIWQLAGLLVLALLIGIGVGFLVWGYPLQKQLSEAQQANQSAQATITAMDAAASAAAEASAAKAADAAAEAAKDATAAPQDTAGAALTPTPKVIRYDVPIDDDPVLGSDDAPITLIEFSDYECPFCKKWNVEVYPRLKEQYGDKIRFVFRDFPLYNIHPNAIPAAESANCAGEQDKYWEYHDLLFAGGKPLGRDTYLAYAQQLGIEQSAFEKCIADRRHQQEVEGDLQYASNLGVQSTPTFFINGLAIVGAQPFEVFEQIINMELAGEIP